MATIKSKKRDKPKHSAGGRKAKKGGKGGHYTWGHVEDDVKYLNDAYAVDDGDPNYESPDEYSEQAILKEIAVSELHKEAQVQFKNSIDLLKRFKQTVEGAANEYLNSADAEEFVRCVNEQDIPQYHHQIVKALISWSLDRRDQDRDAVSFLINSLLASGAVKHNELVDSLNILATRLPEYLIDVPQATNYIIKFIADIEDGGHLSAQDADDFKTLMRNETPDNQESLEAVKKKIKSMFEEYFASSSVEELRTAVRELGATKYHPEVVKRGISLSLDRDGAARELVSQFLADAAGEDDDPHTLIGRSSIEEGFRILLRRVSDLHNDVPDILALLSYFLARAISDEALFPKFLREGSYDHDALQVIDRASAVLKEKHHGSRLEQIWGPGDGRSVKELVEMIEGFIMEYLANNDKKEAIKRVIELDIPHFQHEIVKQLFSHAIDRDEKALNAACNLVQTLYDDGVTTKYQITKGLYRIEKRMSDIIIDVPTADKSFDKFKSSIKL